MVSALARTEGLCLAQVATAGKGQELAAIPDVLALLDFSGGALVSLDALGCQPAIAAQIVNQGGHYLLALKQNQPALCAEAKRALAGFGPRTRPRAGPATTRRGAGRWPCKPTCAGSMRTGVGPS